MGIIHPTAGSLCTCPICCPWKSSYSAAAAPIVQVERHDNDFYYTPYCTTGACYEQRDVVPMPSSSRVIILDSALSKSRTNKR